MYIAYSALRNPPSGRQQQTNNAEAETTFTELQLRYQAYQNTCSKYRREIAAIQQHIPGWQPSPPNPLQGE